MKVIAALIAICILVGFVERYGTPEQRCAMTPSCVTVHIAK